VDLLNRRDESVSVSVRASRRGGVSRWGRSVVKTVALGLCLIASTGMTNDGLENRLEINATKEPIGRVVEKLTRLSEVSIRLSPRTIAALPAGGDTRINVRVKEGATPTLRVVLTAMTQKLGLQFRSISGGDVLIEPLPPLERLGRAATWDELELMAKLTSGAFREVIVDVPFVEPSQKARLINAVEKGGLWEKLAWEAMEEACESMGQEWRLEGKRVNVGDPVDAARQKPLGRTISISSSGKPLADVVREIGDQAGVPIEWAADTVGSVPPSVRDHIYMVAQRTTLREALESICRVAGLDYGLEEDRIVLSPKATTEEGKIDGDDPLVGVLIMPSSEGRPEVEWFLRRSDLTPEMANRRLDLIRRAIGARAVLAALKRKSEPATTITPLIGKVIAPPGQDGSRFEFFIREQDFSDIQMKNRERTIKRAWREFLKASKTSKPAPIP
jgi:hypothetical protein